MAAVTADDTGGINEVVADKGYHSNQVLTDLAALDLRGYIAEPDRGRRNWTKNAVARDAVYAKRSPRLRVPFSPSARGLVRHLVLERACGLDQLLHSLAAACLEHFLTHVRGYVNRRVLDWKATCTCDHDQSPKWARNTNLLHRPLNCGSPCCFGRKLYLAQPHSNRMEPPGKPGTIQPIV